MIIGIDLGSKMGLAFVDKGVRKDSYTLDLNKAVGKEETLVERFAFARDTFDAIIVSHRPSIIYYEHVRRFMSSQAALVYNGLLCLLMIAARTHNIPLIGFAPTEIKKYATGSGKASKGQMIAAAESRTGHKPKDDNEADAIMIALLGSDRIDQIKYAIPKS